MEKSTPEVKESNEKLIKNHVEIDETVGNLSERESQLDEDLKQSELKRGKVRGPIAVLKAYRRKRKESDQKREHRIKTQMQMGHTKMNMMWKMVKMTFLERIVQ